MFVSKKLLQNYHIIMTQIIDEVLGKLRNALKTKFKHQFLAIAILWTVFPLLTTAQMFSVDDSPDRFGIPSAAVFIGFEPIDFNYEGSTVVPGAGAYEFSGNLIRLQFETPGINAYLGTAGQATGLDDFSYFDAGIRVGHGLTVFRNQNVLVQIPLQLHSSITSVNNNELAVNPAPDFDQGTFEFGGGLDFNARLAPQFRIGANVIPSYGFSFSTREGNAGGSVTTVKGQGRLYFDQLFGNTGLSLGYNYNFREFDIDAEVLNYNASSHSILIGITF